MLQFEQEKKNNKGTQNRTLTVKWKWSTDNDQQSQQVRMRNAYDDFSTKIKTPDQYSDCKKEERKFVLIGHKPVTVG